MIDNNNGNIHIHGIIWPYHQLALAARPHFAGSEQRDCSIEQFSMLPQVVVHARLVRRRLVECVAAMSRRECPAAIRASTNKPKRAHLRCASHSSSELHEHFSYVAALSGDNVTGEESSE